MNNNGVKVALVGLGRWGGNVARELHAAGVLAAIVERTPASDPMKEVAKQYEVPVITMSEMLASDIPAAWIATPIATHTEVARALLEGGKHILLEKPATGKVETARELAQIAAEKDLIFATGYVFLYHPVFAELKKIDPATLQQVECTWRKYGSFGEPIELNLFTHHISIALKLFGAPQQGSVEISENGNKLDARLTYDNFVVMSHIDRESEKVDHVLDFTLADGAVYRWDNDKLFKKAKGSSAFDPIFETSERSLTREVSSYITALKGDASHLYSAGDFAARVLEVYDSLSKRALA
jgi:predicted dehydrogenase